MSRLRRARRRLGGRLWDWGVAPQMQTRVREHDIASPHWAGAPLKIALFTDIHAISPWMGPDQIMRLVTRTNAVGADIILCLGDFVKGHAFGRTLPVADIAAPMAHLSAPLGVWAVLGNHDWSEDAAALARKGGPVEMGTALESVGIPVLENTALRIDRSDGAFWLAGLGDQRAFGKRPPRGVDDLDATLAAVTGPEPAILMAHEPDIFPHVPDRFALTMSGHTHGGQVRLFGYPPLVPSVHGRRYVWGHVQEGGRNLVVSGGLGCSGLPLRFGVMPEITVITLRR